MKFNEYLKSLINQSDITNAELARRIGVHKSYITQLANNHCNPPSKYRCNQIAEVLGCDELERTELLLTAIEGRMPDDALEFFNIFRNKIGDVHSLLMQQGKTPSLDKALEEKPSFVLSKLSKNLFNLVEERKSSPKIEKHPVEKVLENIISEFRNSEAVDYSQETLDNCACDVFKFGNTVITKCRWKAGTGVKHNEFMIHNLLPEQHRVIMVVNGSLKVTFDKAYGNGKEHELQEGSVLCFPANLGFKIATISEADVLFLCTDLSTKV